MKTSARVAFATVLVSALAMTGCAYNSSSADVYTAGQAQREQTVRMGTVESVRGVTISSNNGQPTGIGALGGGAAGAVAGNAVENGVAKRSGVEITVRLDNGDLRAITQSATGEIFQAGDRVRLLSSGGVTRVTH
jgi:outer membrane lipoprotein SlyB